MIGSGPAGLTAAFHLARQGCQVTVYEGREEAGGLLRRGSYGAAVRAACRRRFPGRPVKGVIGGFHLLGIPPFGLRGPSKRKIADIGRAMLARSSARYLTGHCTGRGTQNAWFAARDPFDALGPARLEEVPDNEEVLFVADLGDDAETRKPLQVWMKELHRPAAR